MAKRFKTEIIHGDDGHIIANIKGRRVGQAFRHESGQHCCQRVPETETQGRRQTSFISVAVLPLREDVWEPLRESDIEVITQTGKQGAGGQKVNKTSSAVRMKHKPTGLSVFINGRSQPQNKEMALSILTARVHNHLMDEKSRQYEEHCRSWTGDVRLNGSRGEKVRTYNFIESRAIDHRLGTSTNNLKKLMKGDFSELIPS